MPRPKITRHMLKDLAKSLGAPPKQFIARLSEVRICCLCHDPVGGHHGGSIGIFFPTNPQQYGAPENKRRFVFYGLCDDCQVLPGHIHRIEEAMARDLTPQ